MTKSILKILSVIVGLLPASQQVLAKAEVNDDSLRGNQMDNIRLGTNIDSEGPGESVFLIDRNGRIKTIGTKEELKALIKENNRLKRLIEARATAPSCD